MPHVRQGSSVICENCFLTCSRVAPGTFSLSRKGDSVLESWEVWLVTPAKWLFFRGRHNVTLETTGKKKHQMILRRTSQVLLRQVTDPVSLLMEAVLSPRKRKESFAGPSKRQKVLVWWLDFSLLLTTRETQTYCKQTLWKSHFEVSFTECAWDGLVLEHLGLDLCHHSIGLVKGHMFYLRFHVLFTLQLCARYFFVAAKDLKCDPGCKEWKEKKLISTRG